MNIIKKSSKLDNVCYDIRGPVLKEAKRLEEEGQKVLKLNIGNPAPFGFDAPTKFWLMLSVIYQAPRVTAIQKASIPPVKPLSSSTGNAACAI